MNPLLPGAELFSWAKAGAFSPAARNAPIKSADTQIRRIALPDTLTPQTGRGNEKSARRYDELKLKLRLFGKFCRRAGS
jgi:hypothetical protein